MKIGLFGFSRGAYTVRCLGGVLATCGVGTTLDSKPIAGVSGAARRPVADAAVAAYKIKDKGERGIKAGADFRPKYAAAPAMPDIIGVFDTVKALGLAGHCKRRQSLEVRVP